MAEMGEISDLDGVIDRSSELVKKVQDLEGHWKGTTLIAVEHPLRKRTEETLVELGEFADEITAVFMEAPVTSLKHAMFAWACYEAANARLNLTYLLLFGVNQVQARREGLIPNAANQKRRD